MNKSKMLSLDDKNILGEVCNISMGAAATALATLINQRVEITTPGVKIIPWNGLQDVHDGSFVGVRASYTEGLSGSNLLILKARDAKIIANLMMGGTGLPEEPVILNDMDKSAVTEAMNQMIGSAATALTIIDNKKIDISIPEYFTVDAGEILPLCRADFASNETVAIVDFRIEVGDLINSEVVQVMHMDAALELIDALKKSGTQMRGT